MDESKSLLEDPQSHSPLSTPPIPLPIPLLSPLDHIEHESLDKVPGFHPFKRWMDSFRTKKRYRPQRYGYVQGWPETTCTSSESGCEDFYAGAGHKLDCGCEYSCGYGCGHGHGCEFGSGYEDKCAYGCDCEGRYGQQQQQQIQQTQTQTQQAQQWESSSAHSSNLGTVQTATMSIASQSVVKSKETTRSRSTTTQSLGSQSRSMSDARGSLDSETANGNASASAGAGANAASKARFRASVDEEAAKARAKQRREVLREIVSTEADYVLGLKALADILFLCSARPGITHNIQKIRQLHEELLAQIRASTPLSSLSDFEYERIMSHGVHKHRNSVDLAHLGFKPLQQKPQSRRFRMSVAMRYKALAAEANEAWDVAREIGKLPQYLPAYEEFCLNFKQLEQDIDIWRRSVPHWPTFDQGIEALSKSVASIESQGLGNKSMTVTDLLIKPIQRLCKYPLLLQELIRFTHIQDNPSAHDGIRQVLENVRTLVSHINALPDNPVNKDLFQKTLLLQEMLGFPNCCVVHDVYKQLGSVILCGVLHVTYQSAGRITGSFMVCVLFNSHLYFAQVDDDYRKLESLACLYICDVKIDALKNGKGLCCHGCLFSWKLDFQHLGKRYELVLSASSASEERRWNTEILKAAAGSVDVPKSVSSELRGYSFLCLDLTPLDVAFRSASPLCRRPSTHSLVPSHSQPANMQHVVIKKTHSPNKLIEVGFPVHGEIERQKACHIWPEFTLTARRQDRVQLERFALRIYTRHVLPYPGMVGVKGDMLFGSGSIMRRLSHRPALYRRSSSVNLPPSHPVAVYTPCPGKRATEPKEVLHDSRRAKLKSDHHPVEGRSPGIVQRAKSLRIKGIPRRSASPVSRPVPSVEKEHRHFETLAWKGAIWSMIHSMSLGKTKKNSVRGSGGGMMQCS